jgi:hypothetical protein
MSDGLMVCSIISMVDSLRCRTGLATENGHAERTVFLAARRDRQVLLEAPICGPGLQSHGLLANY